MPKRPVAAASALVAALVLALPAAAESQPDESWTGETAPEQREQTDKNEAAATVQDPSVKGSVAPAAPPDEATAGGVTELQRTDQPQEVNAATEQRKDTIVEASPRLGDEDRLVDLIGRDVYSSDGEQLGELSEVLADPDGGADMAVVDGDGFLVFDGGQMRLPLADLDVDGDRLIAPLTAEQAEERMGSE
ncbi:PRC-barrel domain-containing protein [Caenispirillum bisanense]|uniref:PRC-barrel domain-containing protein n=1 Tax=Caenispirillum bisanense TaxID=414052 RepID=A0A286GHN4_9PROT|nr:PRC-barrel domain-containing protein [Caenispirillum bisanense]SOD95043.1 PRC-barrel domain-containing protein [Caenispirillum bisanense]